MTVDGEQDQQWGQDPVIHARIAEVEAARAAARAEEDAKAEDPRVRMLRCFDVPEPKDAA